MYKLKFKHIIIIIVFTLLCFSFLSWFFKEKKTLAVFVTDKTVLNDFGIEHRSFFWVLKNNRYVKEFSGHFDFEHYDYSQDYFGFFPISRKEKTYKVKDLESYTKTRIDSLSNVYDVAYYTDTYGIYEKEWYEWHLHSDKKNKEFSQLIYGGLTKKDYLFLKEMKRKDKLILLEFNTLADPTLNENRQSIENEFGIKWSGWVGKHVETLDTTINKDIHKWFINAYIKQYNREWDFTKKGMLFMNSTGKVLVLEEDTDLFETAPFIKCESDSIKSHFNVSDNFGYSYWFEITFPQNKSHTLATFNILATEKGRKKLKMLNIPQTFPAVIGDLKKNRFYYFTGDFADNPISNKLSYFNYSEYLGFFEYGMSGEYSPQKFFWKFYRPMVEKILSDYNTDIK